MRRLHWLPSVAVSAMLAVASCGEAGRSGDDGDVAGLEVGETVTVVGADDALDGHALYRVVGAVRHADGRLFVADNGSGEVRVFDAAGVLTRRFGGRGAGPGEHRGLGGVWLDGADVVISYDGGGRKLIRWSTAGEVLEEVTLDATGTGIVGYLGGGRFVELQMDAAGGFAQGTSRIDTATIAVIEPAASVRNDVARTPYQTRFAASPPTGGVIYTPLPLEPRAAFAAGADVVYIGYGGDAQIRRYDAAGRPTGAVSMPVDPLPLSPAAREAWQATLIEPMAEERRPDMARYLASLPYSDALPLFDALLVDDTRQLWVRHFPEPGTALALWTVFGEDGEPQGNIRLPATARLHQAGADFVVLTDTGADGTERVLVRELRR